MADRVKQVDEAKVGKTGKSNYDLFGGYDEAKQEAMDKFKGTEIKTPAEEFAGKFGSKLIGTKLVKAIDTYAEEKGIGGADKQTLVSEYINTIRKPVITGTDVKKAYKEDLKGNALVNFGEPLRAGYKELEPFGIKVADKQKEEVIEEKKPVTAKKTMPKKDNGIVNGIPSMVGSNAPDTDGLTKEEIAGFKIVPQTAQKQTTESKVVSAGPKIVEGKEFMSRFDKLNANSMMGAEEKFGEVQKNIALINKSINDAKAARDNFYKGTGKTDAQTKPYNDKVIQLEAMKAKLEKHPIINSYKVWLARK